MNRLEIDCLWPRSARAGSIRPLVGLGNADRGHASSGCTQDAHVSVFKDETVFGRDAETRGSGEEGIRSRLGTRIVVGADQDREAVEQADGGEGLDYGFAAAAGNDGKRNDAVLSVDVLEYLRAGLSSGRSE